MVASKKKSLLLKSLIGVAVAGLGVGGYFVYKAKFEPPTQSQIDRAMESKDYERAIELISRLNLAQDDGSNYANLGEAHFSLNQLPEALQAFIKADDMGFDQSRVRSQIARIYERSGNLDVAASWYADALLASQASGLRNAALDAASSIANSDEYHNLYSGTRARQGLRNFSMKDRCGVWTGFSRTLTRPGNIVVESFMGGRVIEEKFDDPDGYIATYVATERADVWNYASTWSDGRCIVGTAVSTDVLTITGTLTYLDGTQCLVKLVGWPGRNEWMNSFSLSTDKGVSWSSSREQRWWKLENESKSVFL